MWRLALALALSWLVTRVALAEAAPRRPALNWTRSDDAAACIDPRTLAARVEALTGPVFVKPEAADYAIEGHIDRRAGGGFVVRIAVTTPSGEQQGERVIEQPEVDCRALDPAIAFVIALTIDPSLELGTLLLPGAELDGQTPEEALLSELQAHPPQATRPKLPPGPVPARTVRATRPRHRALERSLSLTTAALMSSRELPELGLGASLRGSWQLTGRLALALQLRGLSTLFENEVAPARALRAHAFGGALFACTGPFGTRVALRACVGPEPLWVRGRGVGFAQARTAELVSWGGLAQLELTLQLSARWALQLMGQLRVGFQRKRFVYDEVLRTIPAYTLDRVGGSWGIGVRYAFLGRRQSEASNEQQLGSKEGR